MKTSTKKFIIVVLIIITSSFLGLIAGCKQDTITSNKLITYDTVYYYKVINGDTLLCVSSVTIK